MILSISMSKMKTLYVKVLCMYSTGVCMYSKVPLLVRPIIVNRCPGNRSFDCSDNRGCILSASTHERPSNQWAGYFMRLYNRQAYKTS